MTNEPRHFQLPIVANGFTETPNCRQTLTLTNTFSHAAKSLQGSYGVKSKLSERSKLGNN